MPTMGAKASQGIVEIHYNIDSPYTGSIYRIVLWPGGQVGYDSHDRTHTDWFNPSGVASFLVDDQGLDNNALPVDFEGSVVVHYGVVTNGRPTPTINVHYLTISISGFDGDDVSIDTGTDLPSSSGSFTVTFSRHHPPTVETLAPMDITGSSVTLWGRISSDGREDCQYRFSYWKDGDTRTSTAWQGSLLTDATFSAAISGLTHASTYYYVAEAKNNQGSAEGAAVSVAASVVAVSTPTASSIGNHSATLAAVVNQDLGVPVSYRWTYQISGNPGSLVATPWECCASKGQTISKSISGLSAATQYDFTVEVQNSKGQDQGVGSFTTGPLGVSTPTVSNITQSTATLQAKIIEDSGLVVKCRWTYQISGDPSSVVVTPWACCFQAGETISKALSGLSPGTQYDCTVEIQNAKGTDQGSGSFTTLAPSPVQHTLTLSAANGSIVATPAKSAYDHGEMVSLQANPNAGYHFTGWSGDLSGSTNPATITMDGNKSVTAGFAINTYSLTLNGTNGSIAATPSKSSYSHGETVSLQANANTGYHFTGWSGDFSGSTNPAMLTMDGNKTVQANFVPDDKRTLTTSTTVGGTVTTPGVGSFQYDPGTTVTVTATANANYHFVNWTGSAVTAGKVASPTSASTIVRMDADYSLQANFAPDKRTLTTSTTAGGTVSAPGVGSFQYAPGTSVSVTATANANYHFVNWTGSAVTAGKVAIPRLPARQ
jgi:uncharacterized repeat protein (TIGR02543 family)